MLRLFLVAGIACLAGAPSRAAQAPAPPVRVELRLAQGRTQFKSGEPIRLEMVLIADRPGFVVDVDGPDLASDQISIAPASGVTSVRERPFSDTRVIQDLTSGPVTVPLTLNYWVRFDRPGDYTARVTTRRVFVKDKNSWTPGPEPALTLESGEVHFHVDALDEVTERYLVAAALSHIDATAHSPLGDQIHAAEELAFLPGDEAAIAKYQAYRALGNDRPSNAKNVIARGFFMSRRPLLIVEAFEREFADLSRPISSDAISRAAGLRTDVEHPERRLQRAAAPPVSVTDPWRANVNRYVDAAFGTLDARSGANRLESAIALLYLASGASREVVTDIVIAGFMDLPVDTRHDLMVGPLNENHDPRLTTALARTVATANRRESGVFIDALAARDPEAAVAPLVAILADPAAITLADSIAKVPAGRLSRAGPGILAAMRTLVAAGPAKNSFRIDMKAAALDLVADASVWDEARALYESAKTVLSRDARAHLVAYLSRWDATSGAVRLRDAVMADPSLLGVLAGSRGVPGLGAVCRELLFSADAAVAVEAATALRTAGSPSDRTLIAQRLDQWRIDARRRGAPLDRSDDSIERALAMAVIDGRAWQASDAERASVRAGCVTEGCRAIKHP